MVERSSCSSPAFTGLANPPYARAAVDGDDLMLDLREAHAPPLDSGQRDAPSSWPDLQSLYEDTRFPELNIWAEMARQQSARQPLTPRDDVGVCSLGKRTSHDQLCVHVKRVASRELVESVQ
eukprot:CAMPEP_0184379022 /NCGR_PEP_ID=MMETSP0007-20130409/3508_1 /TAXON_ID=97485 /ORGANISM="Prymnesium parvum, Strain Texoma1" /LENGTH=121 /DNA_ID=CAMNT_0026723505 /DNA_START=24 /DNA_END=389 /DNA_ORIENTATION=-